LGTLFTNGFPPYVLSAAVVLLWIHEYEPKAGIISQSFHLSAAVYCLFLIHPGPVAFLIIPAFIMGIRILLVSKRNGAVRTLVACSISLGILIFVIWTMRQTTGKFGWRQLLQSGGCKAPGLITASITLILFAFATWRLKKQIVHDPLLQVGISGAVSVGVFAGITLYFTGNIQYYAIKQYYIWQALAGIIILKYFQQKFHGKHKLISFGLVGFVLSSSMYFPGRNSGPWMGVAPQAFSATLDSTTWRGQIVDVRTLMKEISLIPNYPAACYISKAGSTQSDINSRWLNAFTSKSKMTDKCFGGFWNSDNLSPAIFSQRLRNLNLNFVVFTDKNYPGYDHSTVPKNVTYTQILN
jgi:hypothetical protein